MALQARCLYKYLNEDLLECLSNWKAFRIFPEIKTPSPCNVYGSPCDAVQSQKGYQCSSRDVRKAKGLKVNSWEMLNAVPVHGARDWRELSFSYALFDSTLPYPGSPKVDPGKIRLSLVGIDDPVFSPISSCIYCR